MNTKKMTAEAATDDMANLRKIPDIQRVFNYFCCKEGTRLEASIALRILPQSICRYVGHLLGDGKLYVIGRRRDKYTRLMAQVLSAHRPQPVIKQPELFPMEDMNDAGI